MGVSLQGLRESGGKVSEEKDRTKQVSPSYAGILDSQGWVVLNAAWVWSPGCKFQLCLGQAILGTPRVPSYFKVAGCQMLEALTPGPGILVCLAIQTGLRLGQHCLRENMKWVPAGFAAAIQTMPSQIKSPEMTGLVGNQPYTGCSQSWLSTGPTLGSV